MNRYLLYTLGSTLFPSKIVSSALVGLTIADISYIVNTSVLGASVLPSLVTSLLVFKATTGIVFTYKSLF